MKSGKVLTAVLLVAVLLIGGIAPAAQADTGTTSTAFVLQNLGSSPANVGVEFRSTDGTVTNTYSGISIPVGAAINMDQRYDTGNPGTDPFKGSVIASSSEPLGSVVNLMRTSGVGSFESYNGVNDAAVGKTVRVLQVLRNVSSGGLIYNTTIAIQNSDTAAATNVKVTFIPDPLLNPAVGGTLGGPVDKTYPIAKGGMLLLDQSTQTDPNIGDKFFGSAKIESDSANVAVVTTSDGGGQVLLAQPSYAGGSTTPISLPSVYKNIMSGGNSYSTAFLIANMGDVDATVQIAYAPTIGTYSGTPDTISIPKGTVKNVDQRLALDAPSITSATFMGSAIVTPTAGSVAVMANLRGGSQYAMTYGGLTSGVGAGSKMYLPVAYKEIASGGRTWSSTIVFQSFTASSQVRLTFTDNRSGFSPWTTTTFTVTPGTQFDLRSHASTDGHSTFFGAVVVEVISGQVGAIVQTRGLGSTGDAMMAYQGLSKP
jgi:hypothetical protein